MEGDELEMFESAVRRAVSGPSGPALDQALAGLGWIDALEADPGSAVSTLFRLQGQANSTSTALERVLATGLGLAPGQAPPVLLPPLGSSGPPGRLNEGGLVVDGLRLTGQPDSAGHDRSQPAEFIIVAVAGLAAPAAVAVGDLTSEAVSGLDPDLGLHRIAGHAVPYQAVTPEGGGSWTGAVSLAQLAVGHELAGGARSMVELACTHALDRVQFGQPIARFQAVRHRLAEALVAVEGAEALLTAAWETPSAELSAAARSVAGRAARTAARHAQQVLAGIGFTAEHPFHRYLRRTMVLDQLFGTSRWLTAGLGARVLAAGRVPDLLPL
jgi:Acyl-CoA dehydrogenase, C-terminal domain